jgi:hypothetical protein
MRRTVVAIAAVVRAVFFAALYLVGLTLMVAGVLFLIVRPLVLPSRAR